LLRANQWLADKVLALGRGRVNSFVTQLVLAYEGVA
jgi:hypothetical protein